MKIVRYTIKGIFGPDGQFADPQKEQKWNQMVAELAAVSDFVVNALAQVEGRLGGIENGAVGLLEFGDLYLLVDTEVHAIVYRVYDQLLPVGDLKLLPDVLREVAKIATAKSLVRLEIKTPLPAVAKAAQAAGFRKVGVLELGGLTQGRYVDTVLLERVLLTGHGKSRNWLSRLGAWIYGMANGRVGKR